MESSVYNIDNMEFMRSLPDKCFDLCIADPPYRDENVPMPEMRKLRSHKEMFSSGRPTDEFFKEIERISKEQIIFGANNFARPFMGFIAWDKCVRGSDRYSQVEIASISEGLGRASVLCQITTYVEDKIHPTQKPSELYAWIFRKYLPNGGRVFDPYLGSGSSRIAAYKLGIDFVGCEIDKTYFDRMNERFELECHGTRSLKDGRTIRELSIFDDYE